MTDLEENSAKEAVGLVVKNQNVEEDVDVPSNKDLDDVTWGEVCRGCFCHTPAGWLKVFASLLCVVFFLFFFIVGLELLGEGAQVMTGCTAGAVFGSDINPVSGLMVGILVTCLLQSSSTTTSIVVTLVGAGTIAVEQGIYMIMGGMREIYSLGHSLGSDSHRRRSLTHPLTRNSSSLLFLHVQPTLERP